jgi:hypothetical protein
VKLPPDFDLRVSQARADVTTRALGTIQKETAITWAARAVASLRLYHETRQPKWYSDAEEYYHEAIEHAALSGDDELLNAVRAAVGWLPP